MGPPCARIVTADEPFSDAAMFRNPTEPARTSRTKATAVSHLDIWPPNKTNPEAFYAKLFRNGTVFLSKR